MTPRWGRPPGSPRWQTVPLVLAAGHPEAVAQHRSLATSPPPPPLYVCGGMCTDRMSSGAHVCALLACDRRSFKPSNRASQMMMIMMISLTLRSPVWRRYVPVSPVRARTCGTFPLCSCICGRRRRGFSMREQLTLHSPYGVGFGRSTSARRSFRFKAPTHPRFQGAAHASACPTPADGCVPTA